LSREKRILKYTAENRKDGPFSTSRLFIPLS
jgi:hypothetical protein